MNKNKNDIVIIELDRPRVLRYGHKALKILSQLTGKSLEELGSGFGADVADLEKIIYAGLLSDAKENGEVLRLEDMEDLLDLAPSFHHIVERLEQAFANAYGSGTEGNGQPTPEQAGAKKVGAGKNH